MIACTACPRLRRHCEQVARAKKREFTSWNYWGKPVPGLGHENAKLLIVGLAPAAHGANRTGRMFTGDSSGNWLYEALHRFGFATQPTATDADDGLQLVDCYVTAAARCAPPQNRPTGEELSNCKPFLEAELQLLANVRVILVLGHIGYQRWLKASGWWDRLPSGERPAFSHGAVAEMPDGTHLICSYHPSRQNTNTGRLTREMWYDVFRCARSLIDRR